MSDLIVIDKYPVKEALKRLLEDKTTGKNIIFATDMYSDYGYTELNTMTIHAIMGFSSCDIQPRVRKAQAEQNLRTRKKAEVFTPTWICNMMNNHCDSEWFGRKDVFNRTDNENHWYSTCERIIFPEGKTWQQYVDSRRLEITCGEAPYLVSRYDTTTGEIIPIKERIGLLDRKLRIVNENTTDEEEWLKWTERAFESVYGYEFQGDNLLIARINMLVTFSDYLRERWHREATATEIKKIANIIAWNLWQMDGLADSVPLGIPEDNYSQISLLDENYEKETPSVSCKIKDWRDNRPKIFRKLKDKNERGVNMKFDYVIGNPPYQDNISDSDGNQSLSKQLFPIFIKEAVNIGELVSLITPSRWFSGDAQDKSFIKLRDFIRENNHIKVLHNFKNGKDVFPNTEIKGGVNFFLYDKSFSGKVKFTNEENGKQHTEIRNLFEDGMDIIISDVINYAILSKVKNHPDFITLTTITTGRNAFGIIGKEDVVNAISSSEYFNGAIELRCKADEIRWTTMDKVTKGKDIANKYKVYISKSAGSPNKDMKIIGNPYVGCPGSVCTDSLFPIGRFDTSFEAESLAKYMKTQFLRFMVYILKMSQNVTQIVYKYVPLQDFTADSDIDWSVSIPEIDKQLYKKYNLTQEEIDFIESHVKEMN